MNARAFARQLGKELAEEQITDLGAMMAYYAVLALFPMLVFVLSLSMLVLDAGTIREGLAMVTKTMPQGASDLLSARVESLITSSRAGFAIVGAALALWGASRGAVGLMNALNRIHEVKETRSWVRRQVVALLVTLGVALLGLVALGLLVVGPVVGHRIADQFGLGAAFNAFWTIGRWLGAGFLVLLLWAIAFRFLPNIRTKFRIFTPGAIVGVLAWLGISALFGIYLRHFGRFEATYGALGGAIIFLMWLWLSNIALLFGAEINDVLRRQGDTRAARVAGAPEPAHA